MKPLQVFSLPGDRILSAGANDGNLALMNGKKWLETEGKYSIVSRTHALFGVGAMKVGDGFDWSTYHHLTRFG